MPYVPPHLRGQSAEGKSNNINSGSRSSSHDNLNSFDRGSGSRWGSDSGAPRRANLPRTPSANNIDSRGSARRTLPSVEAVIGRWEPSDRVKALDEEQIADIRQRLNVDVEVTEGQAPAAAPIESFKDMVSLSCTGPYKQQSPALLLEIHVSQATSALSQHPEFSRSDAPL